VSEVVNRIISLDRYRASPDNYNEHPDEQIADLRRSVRLFGQVRSVVVLDDGQGGFVGVAGHGFIEAAQAEGKTEVKADVIPPDWTAEKVVAYMAADNETARGSSPDLARLAALVAKLKETDEELAAVAAGGDARLKELLRSLKAPAGEDDSGQVNRAAELQAKWSTATGQLWQLGEHRLICGDCADAAVVARVMGGEKAGCCVTDPPYGINREGITNDDPEGLRALFDGCLAAMPIDDGVLIAFQSPRLEWVWLDATRAAGWHPERLLWMYKPNDETFPWRGWLLTSEAIRASSKGKAEWLDVHPYSHDCYSPTTLGQELSDTEGWHASVKPQAVVIDLVKRVGGIVYDPFLGSGTTMVAAHRLGRRCFGIEIDPGYCAVTLERMSGLGVTPILVE